MESGQKILIELKNDANRLYNYYYNTRRIFEKCRFNWTIENFRSSGGRVGQCLKSPEFFSSKDSKCKWNLCFYPNGYFDEEDKFYVGIYLALASGPNIDIFCDVEFSIYNANDHEIHTARDEFLYLVSTRKPVGYRHFLKRETFLMFIIDGLIKLRVTVTADVGESKEYHNTIQIREPQNKLISDYEKMQTNGKFSDLTICVGKRQFSVHRAILATRSPVFDAMFEHDTLEMQNNQVTITDLEEDTVDELLRFIYTSRYSENEIPAVMKLLCAADKYAMDDLKEICENAMICNMNGLNAFGFLLFADMHSAITLKKEAINFICSNPSHFLTPETYSDISTAKSSILADIVMKLGAQCTK